jgi:hypothetical protein
LTNDYLWNAVDFNATIIDGFVKSLNFDFYTL